MDELVPVRKQKNGSVVVSGRDLHEFLEVNTPYTQWFDRMTEYGFDENVDFIGLSQKSEKPFGGRPQLDHAMTLDMAKEISMIQRTERGKQARQYFIQVEKRYKQNQLPQTPEEKLALTMQVANRLNDRMSRVEDDIDYIKNKSEIDSTQRYQLVDNYFAMRQSIQSENKALLADKRLEIMEQNAATRRAQLMYKIAMATKSQRHRELMLNRAGKELVGEMVIPAMEVESVEYTASEVAEKLGVLTKAGKPYPAKVGEYANRISLKAEQPGQNEYGRWIISKSKYSAKEVAQWVYFEAGVQKLKEYLELIK